MNFCANSLKLGSIPSSSNSRNRRLQYDSRPVTNITIAKLAQINSKIYSSGEVPLKRISMDFVVSSHV
jgi:hypothetical protein